MVKIHRIPKYLNQIQRIILLIKTNKRIVSPSSDDDTILLIDLIHK